MFPILTAISSRYGGADGFELVLDLLEDACEGLYETLKDGKL